MCNCLERVKGKLAAHHGPGSEISLELKQTIDTTTMELGKALPPLYYSYKDGKKRKRSHVVFSFCPFCGTKDGSSTSSDNKILSAKTAIDLTLNRIANDPNVRDRIGCGDKVYHELTAALATLADIPVESVRDHYIPGSAETHRIPLEK